MWDNIQVNGIDPSLLKLENYEYASITDAIIGNKCVRYGACPTTDNRRILEKKIEACYALHKEIRFLVPWGINKGYGQFDIRTADLLDLMALRRFASLNEQVKEFHVPGIFITLFWEDTTEEFLSGPVRPYYYNSISQLIHKVGLDDIVRIVKESDLLSDGWKFREVAIDFARSIHAGKSNDIGWQGEINWQYYLKRSLSEFPNESEDTRRWAVSKYLGCSLARRHFVQFPPFDIKATFAPYPSNIPNSMRMGRVEWKLKADKNSHKTATPWTAFGVLRTPSNWTFVSANEAREGYGSGRFSTKRISLNDTVELPVLVES